MYGQTISERKSWPLEVMEGNRFMKKKFYNFGFKKGNALQLCKEAWRTCKLHMISKSQSVVAL